MKKILSIIIAILVIGFLGVVGVALWPTSSTKLEADNETLNNPDMIKKGQYLAVLGDCSACHSRNGAPAFSGGGAIQSPIGNMYAPNITPDKTNGIGAYSLNDFSRALRYGIRKDGVTLYPSMPYPSFSRLSDDDVTALYAYFQFGVTASAEKNSQNEISWPLSIRWPLAIWRKAFAPSVIAFDAKRYNDMSLARGAYIVQGLGHCGTCHTPRAISLQEKALDESDPLYLSGKTVIEGWVTTNLHNNTDGLANWTEEDIVATLKTGRNPKGVVIGAPMNSFVERSGSLFTDTDLQAVAKYLKTLAPLQQDNAHYQATAALAVAPEMADTNFLYQKNCSTCHGLNGQGISGLFPPLAGNPTVLAENGQSVMRLALYGYRLPNDIPGTFPLNMPGFAHRLSDDELAKVISYIRNNWGNSAPAVTADQVKNIRIKYAPHQE